MIEAVLKWLMASPVGEAVRSWAWLYPALETVHVIGLALVFGGIVLLDLRLLGVSKSIPVRTLAGHILPWVFAGFVLNLASGLSLFASDAVNFAANRSFQVKMVLIVLAGLNALAFHRGIYRSAEDWDRDVPAPAGAKMAAVLSLAAWAGVISMGRMMAYWE